MKYPDLLGVVLLAAATTFGAGSVLAQTTAPSATTPGSSALVVSDVAPPPAEDRSSTGALVLENSPVRAQRESASTRTMGAGPSPRLLRHKRPAQAEADPARGPEQALDVQRRGVPVIEN